MAGAREALERALILDPNNAGAHRGLGVVDKAADRIPEARAHYDEGAGERPDGLGADVAAGRSRLSSGSL